MYQRLVPIWLAQQLNRIGDSLHTGRKKNPLYVNRFVAQNPRGRNDAVEIVKSAYYSEKFASHAAYFVL